MFSKHFSDIEPARIQNTVVTHNRNTPNSDTYPNSDALFAPIKYHYLGMSRILEKNTLVFLKRWANKNSFFFIFEKLCYTGLNLSFLILELVPSIRNPTGTQIVKLTQIVAPLLSLL